VPGILLTNNYIEYEEFYTCLPSWRRRIKLRRFFILQVLLNAAFAIIKKLDII
jgi:hypothetical protein